MTGSVRADADQSLIPRHPGWGSLDVVPLLRRGSLYRYPTRTQPDRVQRISDHLRGFVFGAAAILALVAVYVFAGGTPT